MGKMLGEGLDDGWLREEGDEAFVRVGISGCWRGAEHHCLHIWRWMRYRTCCGGCQSIGSKVGWGRCICE